MQVNKKQLAEIIGYSERALTDWQKEGMPMLYDAARGASNAYDTAQVIQWMVRRELDKFQLESPRDRLDRIRADREELALAKDLESVAPLHLIEAQWRDHILASRTELLTLPDILASEIHALYHVDIDSDLIRARIEASLEKLEHYDADDDIESFDGPDDGESGPEDDEGGGEGVGASAADEDH